MNNKSELKGSVLCILYPIIEIAVKVGLTEEKLLKEVSDICKHIRDNPFPEIYSRDSE